MCSTVTDKEKNRPTGHRPGKKQREVNMRETMTWILLAWLLLRPVLAGAQEIRWETFAHGKDAVHFVAAETFVIARAGVRPALIGEIRQNTPCLLPVVRFPLGSGALQPDQTAALLAGLDQCRVTPEKPLRVLGHTCSLGPEQVNLLLARQRAENVAQLLKNQGYTVTEVKGAGPHMPVTTEAGQMALNRRVEITPTEYPPAESAGLQTE